ERDELMFGRLLVKSDVDQKTSYQNQQISYRNISGNFRKLAHMILSFKSFAKNKESIPHNIFKLSDNRVKKVTGRIKGSMNATPNQPADKFTSRSEIIPNQLFISLYYWLPNNLSRSIFIN